MGDNQQKYLPIRTVSGKFPIDQEWVRAVRRTDLLIDAVTRNDTGAVQQLIETNRYNPNQGNAWDEKPLHHATKLDNPHQMIDLLLLLGADPNGRDHINNAPIHWAAIYRNPDAVNALLYHPTRATDPNLPGQLQQTGLLIAIEQGDTKTAEIFVQHPLTDIDRVNAYGTDARKMAELFCPKYAGQDQEIVKLLELRTAYQKEQTTENHLDEAVNQALNEQTARNLDRWRNTEQANNPAITQTSTKPGSP